MDFHDDGVYFSAENYRQGKLLFRTNLMTSEMKRGFCLWKLSSSDAAAAISDGSHCWNSPWGRGRPGWHVECAAMSMFIFVV